MVYSLLTGSNLQTGCTLKHDLLAHDSMYRLHQDFPGTAVPKASRALAEYLERDEERPFQRGRIGALPARIATASATAKLELAARSVPGLERMSLSGFERNCCSGVAGVVSSRVVESVVEYPRVLFKAPDMPANCRFISPKLSPFVQ